MGIALGLSSTFIYVHLLCYYYNIRLGLTSYKESYLMHQSSPFIHAVFDME
jgi:hypothetical protein